MTIERKYWGRGVTCEIQERSVSRKWWGLGGVNRCAVPLLHLLQPNRTAYNKSVIRLKCWPCVFADLDSDTASWGFAKHDIFDLLTRLQPRSSECIGALSWFGLHASPSSRDDREEASATSDVTPCFATCLRNTRAVCLTMCESHLKLGKKHWRENSYEKHYNFHVDHAKSESRNALEFALFD